MSRKNQNKLVLGDWNAICDVCGWKFKASDLRPRWDHLMVCEQDWEPRHPQDFIRAIPDMQKVPWTRPEATNIFSDHTTTSLPGDYNPSNVQVGPDRATYFDTFAYFDYPVPTFTLTPSVDSMVLGINYSSTNTQNVFEGRVILNGTQTIATGTSGTLSLDLSAYTFAEGEYPTLEYEIEDVKGNFHNTTYVIDPYFGYVTLLAHFNNSLTTDSSLFAQTLTPFGSAALGGICTFGGASLYCPDGASGVAVASSSDLTLSGAFTFECSVYVDSSYLATHQFPLEIKDAASPTPGEEYLEIHLNRLFTTFLGNSGSASVAGDTWYRVAVTRDATNTVRIFYDGTLIDSYIDNTIRAGSSSVRIGQYTALTGLYGYIDEVRYTQGVCRYTADYTISPIQFPDY